MIGVHTPSLKIAITTLVWLLISKFENFKNRRSYQIKQGNCKGVGTTVITENLLWEKA